MQGPATEWGPFTNEFIKLNQVSEDCLYLNVWTPSLETTSKLPVIVFIHGGGFGSGSGAIPIYDGENLAGGGVVVVTINYRLGVFGFLAHPELTAESPHHSSGNYGLLDQIAALRWVKKNIAAFGGDPDQVTIWGQSAGAFSVAALVASPEAKGLFTRAMADSGIGIAGSADKRLEDAQKIGVAFAAQLHAQTIQQLRALPAASLVSGVSGVPGQFAPVVDGWVLPDSPKALSKSGSDNDVPVITGWQANDSLLMVPPYRTAEEFDAFAHHYLGSMAPEFERLYPAATDEARKQAIADGMRDRARVAMFLWAAERAQSHHSPVYTYFFDRGIPWPQHPEYGAFHTAELLYFFRNFEKLDRPWEPVDYQVSWLSSSYLKAFAATDSPNANGLPKWSKVDPAVPSTMEIGEKTGMIPLADKAKLDFWVKYYHSPDSKNAPLF